MSFLNKVVLVTGAGSGIGQAVSLQFAKYTARLSLVDKDEENLKKTGALCQKLIRAKVLTTVAELREEEDIKKAVANTKAEFGRIDIVVNCAGIYRPTSIFDSNLVELFDDVMATNLRSVVFLINCVANDLVETKGNIINITGEMRSLGAFKGIAYQTTIAALEHFTTSIALELAPKGVRVNSISPGVVKTNILDSAGVNSEESEAFWSKASSAPLNKLVKTEDIAEFVTFLASDKARAMTGCTYSIDAGLGLSRHL
ncbi:unnamed protein product [Spodoptera littoralis]|uniref:Uncharacterized protein n=1 Tax=Spodoptera littoralis TaxID=7109 RepID=A0A9P0HZ25_SPOLI|nr:unnamed protein product [Spodoptera littoralis]CAH1636420.1 unnamed protein product [Spodoptera littoralis]